MSYIRIFLQYRTAQVSMQLFSYLCREKVGSKVISVAVTPNGYADAINGNRFVMPEERQMTFTSLLDIVEGKVKSSGVFYVQKQCSNLTEELPELTGDVKTHIPWMSEALGMSTHFTFSFYFPPG